MSKTREPGELLERRSHGRHIIVCQDSCSPYHFRYRIKQGLASPHFISDCAESVEELTDKLVVQLYSHRRRGLLCLHRMPAPSEGNCLVQKDFVLLRDALLAHFQPSLRPKRKKKKGE